MLPLGDNPEEPVASKQKDEDAGYDEATIEIVSLEVPLNKTLKGVASSRAIEHSSS